MLQYDSSFEGWSSHCHQYTASPNVITLKAVTVIFINEVYRIFISVNSQALLSDPIYEFTIMIYQIKYFV